MHQSPDGAKFERHLGRKKHQTEEDQYWEAGVLISELETIDTNKAFSALRKRISNQSKLTIGWLRFSRIAAILIIPLFLYTIWHQIDDKFGTKNLSYQEISNPSGVRSKITLPDGSNVWLNAESTIRYAIPFVRRTREVELHGEAYFDVSKNPSSPLEVKFNQLTVRVLGTQFNVKSFSDDNLVEVVLKEGSIVLDNNRKGILKEQIYMKPNQRWVLNKTTHISALNDVDADQYIAWHKNKLVLNKTSMADLAKMLERWYGVKVSIKDQDLYKNKFTTVFDNEPLYRVIELLELSSPIRMTYIPGTLNKETGETEKSTVEITNQ